MRIPEARTVFGDFFIARVYENNFCVVNFFGVDGDFGDYRTQNDNELSTKLFYNTLFSGLPLYTAPHDQDLHVYRRVGLCYITACRQFKMNVYCLNGQALAGLEDVKFPDLDEVYCRCMAIKDHWNTARSFSDLDALELIVSNAQDRGRLPLVDNTFEWPLLQCPPDSDIARVIISDFKNLGIFSTYLEARVSTRLYAGERISLHDNNDSYVSNIGNETSAAFLSLSNWT